MTATGPSASQPLDPVAFAEKLLSLLDTGRKTATYKFATLTALIDLCVEAAPGEQDALVVSAKELGQRVFEMFWRQAVPYVTEKGHASYLRHSWLSREHQPDLVVKIEKFRQFNHLSRGSTPSQARSADPRGFDALVEAVTVTVIRMPLPKLQRFGIGGSVVEDRFLYEYSWPDEVPERLVRGSGFDDRLRLHPGVAGMLARLGTFLRPVIEARWAAFVAERSREAVGGHDLSEFLFGASRVSLSPVRPALRDLQDRECFYCCERIVGDGDVDHFIPWSRYPDNGIENLVLAHPACNNHKRDSMAAAGHLEGWLRRNRESVADLTLIARDSSWPTHSDRTLGAARSIYLWLPDATNLWLHDWDYEPLDRARVSVLLG